MKGRTDRIGVAIRLTALALTLPGTAAAADAPPSKPQSKEELDEVLVEGRRSRTKDPQSVLNWMSRLVGRFVVEGTVDLRAQGKREDFVKVQGRADCIGFGIGPGVQCQLKVRWPDTQGPDGAGIPGGAPALNPAVMLFGFEKDQFGIHYTLVDSKGFAELAKGALATPDVLDARSTCGATRGDCTRRVRITALADLKAVEMKIDQMIDQQKAVSYTIVMRRVPGSPSIIYGRKQ